MAQKQDQNCSIYPLPNFKGGFSSVFVMIYLPYFRLLFIHSTLLNAFSVLKGIIINFTPYRIKIIETKEICMCSGVSKVTNSELSDIKSSISDHYHKLRFQKSHGREHFLVGQKTFTRNNCHLELTY